MRETVRRIIRPNGINQNRKLYVNKTAFLPSLLLSGQSPVDEFRTRKKRKKLLPWGTGRSFFLMFGNNGASLNLRRTYVKIVFTPPSALSC